MINEKDGGRGEEIAEMTKRIGSALVDAFRDAQIEGPPLGFLLWIFDVHEDPFVVAVSNEITNARRPELIRVMREHLARLEADERAEGKEQCPKH